MLVHSCCSCILILHNNRILRTSSSAKPTGQESIQFLPIPVQEVWTACFRCVFGCLCSRFPGENRSRIGGGVMTETLSSFSGSWGLLSLSFSDSPFSSPFCRVVRLYFGIVLTQFFPLIPSANLTGPTNHMSITRIARAIHAFTNSISALLCSHQEDELLLLWRGYR